MNKDLSDLLNSITIGGETSLGGDQGGNFTHVTVFPPIQRWLIRPHKIGNFWSKYSELVNRGENNLCVAEVNGSILPLIANFKFCFDSVDDSDETMYDDKFLLTLISCVQTVILETLQVSDEKKELLCCVLETSSSWIEINIDESRILCRSIGLHFPFCRIEAVVASQLIFPRLISIFRQRNVIGLLPSQPCYDWEKIMDLDVLMKPVLMYGSVNHPGEQIKTLSSIYGIIERDHVDGLCDPDTLDPYEVFKFKHHPDVVCGNVTKDMLKDEDIEFWLPLALSVNFWSGVVRIKDFQQVKVHTKKLLIGNVKLDDSEFTLCKQLMPLLNRDRFNQKIYWLDIGKALYKSTEGSEDGLNEWIRVSADSKIEDLDDEMCEEIYSSFYDTNVSVKTIAWYAKEDSPEGYENWHQNWVRSALDESLSMLDNDMAKAFYRCYWLNFCYVPTGKRSGSWYKFGSHRWFMDEKALELKRKLSADFVKRYEKLRVHYSQQAVNATDDFSKSRFEDKIEKINKIVKPLRKNAPKRTLISEAEEFFEIENFDSILNQNPNCIAHRNCVSEVCDDQIIFRPGKPEDFISKSTGVKYDPNLSWDHDLVTKTMKWFHQVFPDEELCDCFCKYGASWFIGGNPDKIIPCWTGERDNSKTSLVKGFEAAFGEYCFKVDNAIVTSLNKNPNGATPQLAQMNGARGGFTDELDEEEIMKANFYKKVAGGDTFYGRFLHDNGGKIKVMFKFIVVCNKVPRMNSVHGSIKSKFFIFPFLALFSDDAPKDEAMQIKMKHFERDPRFEKQIPKLAPAILWIFSKYYPKYINEKLKIPKIVQEYTNAYWKDVDVYQLFKQEFVSEAWIDKEKGIRNTDAKINVSDLFREFKPWFKSNYEGEKVPNLRDFKLEMVRIFGKLSEDKYLYGLYITTRQAIDLDSNGANSLKNQVKLNI